MLDQSLSEKNRHALLQEKETDEFSARRLPIHERLKNYPAPQDELDLHSCTAQEATQKTDTFIRTVRMRGMQTVRIVMGKGLHSEGKPVLPDVIEGKIVSLKKDGLVLTFAWKKRSKLNSGALIVYINK